MTIGRTGQHGKISRGGFSAVEMIFICLIVGLIFLGIVKFGGNTFTSVRKYQVRNQLETDARRLISTLNGTLPLSKGQVSVDCSSTAGPPCHVLKFTTIQPPICTAAGSKGLYTLQWIPGNQVTLAASFLTSSPGACPAFGPQILASNVSQLTFYLPDSRNTNMLYVTLGMSTLVNSGDPNSAVTFFLPKQRLSLVSH